MSQTLQKDLASPGLCLWLQPCNGHASSCFQVHETPHGLHAWCSQPPSTRLAKEVRQTDLAASCRHMNFRSKLIPQFCAMTLSESSKQTKTSWLTLLRLERHDVEMVELYKQRQSLKLCSRAQSLALPLCSSQDSLYPWTSRICQSKSQGTNHAVASWSVDCASWQSRTLVSDNLAAKMGSTWQRLSGCRKFELPTEEVQLCFEKMQALMKDAAKPAAKVTALNRITWGSAGKVQQRAGKSEGSREKVP